MSDSKYLFRGKRHPVDKILAKAYDFQRRSSQSRRLHDDTDGKTEELVVTTAVDSDIYISILDRNSLASLRFRNSFGGGRSLRVHAALVLLQLAIDADNAELPDPL